jgi:carboxymethylenebutenolidase
MGLRTRAHEVEMGRLHSPQPGSSAPHHGIVLIHDVWGLSEHSRALASDLASEGFVVLEIDLYRSLESVSIEQPGAFIRSLSDPEILADLDAAADWLSGEACGGRKPGVVGVCMGGTYTLLAACLSDRFAAAAPFYGILSYVHGMLAAPEARDFDKKPLAPLEAAARLQMPLLASFGAEDEFVPVEDVRSLERTVSNTGMRARVDLYEGAGHAFLNRTRKAAYRAQASKDAWDRLIPFLQSEL